MRDEWSCSGSESDRDKSMGDHLLRLPSYGNCGVMYRDRLIEGLVSRNWRVLSFIEVFVEFKCRMARLKI